MELQKIESRNCEKLSFQLPHSYLWKRKVWKENDERVVAGEERKKSKKQESYVFAVCIPLCGKGSPESGKEERKKMNS